MSRDGGWGRAMCSPRQTILKQFLEQLQHVHTGREEMKNFCGLKKINGGKTWVPQRMWTLLLIFTKTLSKTRTFNALKSMILFDCIL